MKKLIYLAAFIVISMSLNAQIVIFYENFETSPVTSFVNSYTDSLPDGPSPCSQASRGTTADFNSTHVDFQSTQNATYFLGVNPESPCGGYYNAFLVSDTLDLSGYDSLVFKSKYFMSSTLNWGPSIISIVFDNSTDKDTIESEFVNTDNWDSIKVTLPVSMIASQVLISINMGGGEGAALDDIEISGYNTSTGLSKLVENNVFIYPNPAQENIYWQQTSDDEVVSIIVADLTGQKIISQNVTGIQNNIDISALNKGIYFLMFIFDDHKIESYKFIKQ